MRTDQKTLGDMHLGEYEFSTQSKELMEIISVKLSQKLTDNPEWKIIIEGINFNAPKNSAFKVRVSKLVNYTCSYFDEKNLNLKVGY